MTSIYAAIERNRRAYERLVGGQNGNLRHAGDAVPHQPALGWQEPHGRSNAAPAGTPMSSGFDNPALGMSLPSCQFPIPSSEFPYSLSPAPPDPMETAELFTRAAEAEERFISQDLGREER